MYSWYNSFKETERGKTSLFNTRFTSKKVDRTPAWPVRITETRRAVLSILSKVRNIQVDAIYQDLKPAFPIWKPATVYNNLKVLIEEGFVQKWSS